ncbi:MAG: histidine phosphatase family protein [Candidatus Goldbacteria bacterium]|nr:histidine phosphatase family protein [Candidatus Goldiibacteriota bacterium]
MNIYLVRHGETDWNKRLLFQGQTDIPLNKKGLSQAKRIGREFCGKKIDAVISSDLMRAVQTAEQIKAVSGYKGKIQEEKLFRERHYGQLEGKKYESGLRDEDFGVENDISFFKRIKKGFMKAIKENKHGANIVIVCHGGVVRGILALVLELQNYKRLRMYNASISEIHFNKKRNAYFVTLFNSISHLSKQDRDEIREHLKGV